MLKMTFEETEHLLRNEIQGEHLTAMDKSERSASAAAEKQKALIEAGIQGLEELIEVSSTARKRIGGCGVDGGGRTVHN
jgi:hypothetical protein